MVVIEENGWQAVHGNIENVIIVERNIEVNEENARAHWNDFVKPLIILVFKLRNDVIKHDERWFDLMEYLYVWGMVHGAKHEREGR